MKRLKKFILTTIILGLITMAIIWVTNSNVTAKTEKVIFTALKDVPKTKVAIIFGAGINGDQPSRYLRDRLDAGFRYTKTTKWIKYCYLAIMAEMNTTNLP